MTLEGTEPPELSLPLTTLAQRAPLASLTPSSELISWLEDPFAEAEHLTVIERQKATWRMFLGMATPEVAAEIATSSILNPAASAQLVVGAAIAGIPAEDAMIAEAAQLEIEMSGEIGGGLLANVGDFFRGFTRWTALAFEGAYDEVVNRPLRTMANMKSYGMDLGEAYANSGNAPFGQFGEALGTLFSGEEVNLGRGFLAQSNLAVPVQQLLAQIDEDAKLITEGSEFQRNEVYERYGAQYGYKPPGFVSAAQQQMVFATQMRERILTEASDPSTELGKAQSQYGAPITQRQLAEKDAVLWNAGRHRDQAMYSQVSVGRVFAGLVTEAGTTPFHLASGGIDFMANIFMDPAAIAGWGIAKASKARTALAPTAKTAELVATSHQAADAAARGADNVATELADLIQNPSYQRYQGWSPDHRAKASQLARRGEITDDMVRYGEASASQQKYQRAGQVADEVRRLQTELSSLVNDPDFLRFEGYADITRSRLVSDVPVTGERLAALERINPRLAAMQRTANRATEIRSRMVDVGARISELGARDEWRRFQGWAPSTQDKALALARQADIDPNLNPRLAAWQRTAREAMKISDEVGSLTDARNMLEEASSFDVHLRRQLLLDGPRKGVNGFKVEEFLRGKTAKPFIDELAGADLAGVDRALRHVKGPISRQLRTDLADATTPEEVFLALLPHFGATVTSTGRSLGRAMATPVAAVHRVVNERVTRKVLESGFNKRRTAPLFSGSKLVRAFSQMSPHSMDLNDLDHAYELLAHHALNIGWKRGDESLEGLLRSFAEISDGDWQTAFDVLGAYQVEAIRHLTNQGVSDDVARHITTFIRDQKADATYWINNVGGQIIDDRIVVAGQVMSNPDPHLMAELFKGHVVMPDPRAVRHGANELDVIGRLMNRAATKGKGQIGEFEQRAYARVLNNIMTRFWKPAVLGRIAWPVRVVGEEQFRAAAAGISQPITHPIQYIARIIHSKVSPDVFGDAFMLSDEFAQASARRVHFQGDWRQNTKSWELVKRSGPGAAPHKVYREALIGELNQLWADPIVKRLFRPNMVDGTHANRIDDATRYIFEGEGRPLLERLVANTDAATREAMTTDIDVVRKYVESVYARAHQKAGGNWQLIVPDSGSKTGAVWFDANGNTGIVPEGSIVPSRPTYQVTSNGIDELTESFGTGSWRDIGVAERFAENADVLAANPSLIDIELVRKQMNNLIATQGDRLPQVLKGVKAVRPEDISRWDEGVSRLFDVLMSRPTNRLSRHPAFREYYWRHLGEMAQWMDAPTLKAAREGADLADNLWKADGGIRRGFEEAASRAAGKPRKIIRGADVEGVGIITDLKMADEAAKGFALTSVQDLLFDVSKRKNASDALSIVMPFADAWGEVLGSWLRITRDQNIGPWRRFQQMIESGRESNPMDHHTGWKNEGFFRKDGDREVFTVPIANGIFNSLAGTSADWQYALDGLSIATSVLPGVGPVVQMIAQPFIPSDPSWDFLREFISPVGQTSIQRGLAPSSWQRVLGAFDFTRNTFADPALIQLYDGAVIDALSHMSRIDPQFTEKWNRDPEGLLSEARQNASQLFLVQALARFVGPAAPSTRPTAEDKDGKIWQVSVLHDEYYRMLELNDGDHLAATTAFVNRFGLNPMSITTPKSTQIRPRGATSISYGFQRENPQLFADFPNIAYFLGPAHLDDFVDFDWDAYYAQIVEGTRERIDPETWMRLRNDTLGRFAYEKAKAEIEETYGRAWDEAGWPTALKDELSIMLRTLDWNLMQEYDGYTGASFGSDVEGLPQRASTQTMISEFIELVATRPELVALDDEGQPENPGAYAVAVYLQTRDWAIGAAQARGSTTPFTAGDADVTSVFYEIRQILREKAASLIVAYPQFGPIWEGVFGRELVDDDDELTIEDAYEIMTGTGYSYEG